MTIDEIDRRIACRDTHEDTRTVLLSQRTQARAFQDKIWVRRALHCVHELNEKFRDLVRGGGPAFEPSELSEIVFDYWFFDEV